MPLCCCWLLRPPLLRLLRVSAARALLLLLPRSKAAAAASCSTHTRTTRHVAKARVQVHGSSRRAMRRSKKKSQRFKEEASDDDSDGSMPDMSNVPASKKQCMSASQVESSVPTRSLNRRCARKRTACHLSYKHLWSRQSWGPMPTPRVASARAPPRAPPRGWPVV